ncbi:MAG TPA: vWA domain-containing protein [Gammaproteobacteria bacterium]|nr:vWA domain-containing protein [Gammaproteobacteria bacterium]
MKTNILLAGLVLATVGAVLVYPTLRGHATGVESNGPHANLVVAPPSAPKRVQVVFVLDTTGSMGGLIAAAKEKIWSIASTLAQARQAPEISMGLVAYRDRGDAYVTRVIDLDKDLDSMYAKLMDFRADGGGDSPESVNQALDDATNKISWSQDADTYRVIFLVGDAPPHMDYQDDVKYPVTIAAAAAKGIVVNTIQCGGMRETVQPWQEIAALGRGRYFTVDQAGSAVAVTTPFDDKLATLSAELDSTRLYYGSRDEVKAMESKVEASAALRASASPAAQARRGVFNASESGKANLLGGKDLVDDVASGRVALDAVPAAELPPSIAALPRAEQEVVVTGNRIKREDVQRQIAELAKDRDAFIKKKVEEAGGAAGSLDQKIYDAVREQAAKTGLEYDGGPKF